MDKRYRVEFEVTFNNGLHVVWEPMASYGSRKEAEAYIDGAQAFDERGTEFRIYDTKLEVVL